MKKILAFFSIFIFSFSLVSASHPISLSLWENISYPKDSEISGLELGLGSFLSKLKGIQLNFFLSESEEGVGAEIGLINVSSNFKGLQFGCLNIGQNLYKGFQLGFVNIAEKEIKGFQLGFFNYAHTGEHFVCQLGLINCLKNSIIYEWFPFVNILF